MYLQPSVDIVNILRPFILRNDNIDNIKNAISANNVIINDS